MQSDLFVTFLALDTDNNDCRLCEIVSVSALVYLHSCQAVPMALMLTVHILIEQKALKDRR